MKNIFLSLAFLTCFTTSTLAQPVGAAGYGPGPTPFTTPVTVPNGGTGATTLTGVIKGNGTSAMSAATAGTDYVAPAVQTVGTIIPAQVAGIVGTTTNNSAQAGSVGEYLSTTVVRGSAITITTTGTAQDITSLALTAGDWDVRCTGYFIGGAGTTFTRYLVYLNTSSNSLNTTPGYYETLVVAATAIAALGDQSRSAAGVRYSVSGPTTIYCGGFADFAISTAQFYGFISARRIR